MNKGVIFDLDGVLVSTDHYHYLAWKRMAEEENLAFDETLNNQLRGVSRMASLDIILTYNKAKYSDEAKTALATKKNTYYRVSLEDLNPTHMLPGALKTLNTLKELGVKLAIGSSSKNARYILNKLEITDYFDAIVDGTDITESKPHPEVFLKAQEALGVEKSACYVIEDAESGIEAANRANLISIGINDAETSPQAKHTIHALPELIKIIN